jgi:hypothetical protein
VSGLIWVMAAGAGECAAQTQTSVAVTMEVVSPPVHFAAEAGSLQARGLLASSVRIYMRPASESGAHPGRGRSDKASVTPASATNARAGTERAERAGDEANRAPTLVVIYP